MTFFAAVAKLMGGGGWYGIPLSGPAHVGSGAFWRHRCGECYGLLHLLAIQHDTEVIHYTVLQ